MQDRLAGVIAHPDGTAVPDPSVRWIGQRHGRRQDRRVGCSASVTNSRASSSRSSIWLGIVVTQPAPSSRSSSRAVTHQEPDHERDRKLEDQIPRRQVRQLGDCRRGRSGRRCAESRPRSKRALGRGRWCVCSHYCWRDSWMYDCRATIAGDWLFTGLHAFLFSGKG